MKKRESGTVKRGSCMGFIGGGNMAEAFIGALLRSKIYPPSAIQVSDVDPKRLKILADTYGIGTTSSNIRVFSESDTVLFAVKPQQMQTVLSALADSGLQTRRKKKLLISIVAGFPIRKIEKRLLDAFPDNVRKRFPIIRVMPNTPAQVLKGVSAMSPNRHASLRDLQRTRKILSAIGCVLEFSEKDLDAVTALSGSGPAYVFYFIEALVEAGIRVGLTRKAASTLTVETFAGALALLQEQSASPESLRRKVTSPGGTTEAALRVMEEGKIKAFIGDAVIAATRRAKTLSRCHF